MSFRPGDEVFIRREGEPPSWFRWQGLPGEVMRYESPTEVTVRMPDGNSVAFYESELVLQSEWSSLVGKPPLSDPPYPPRHPETIGSSEDPTKSEVPTSEGGGLNLVPRGRYMYDVSCRYCARAVREAWFGLQSGHGHCARVKPDGTYCHATWSGLNAIHCVECHLTFTSPSAFGKHKASNNVCLDPAEVTTRGGRPYFGEPTTNDYGTVMWRQSGDGRPTFERPT